MTCVRYVKYFFVFFLLSFKLSYAANENALVQAMQLLDAWQLKEASALVREQFQQFPKDPNVLFLGARVAFYQGEFAKALDLLNQAKTQGFVSQDLIFEQVVKDTARITSSFLFKSSAHFKVFYAPFKDEILADLMLPVLENAYIHIGQSLGFEHQSEIPIAVLVVDNAEALSLVSTLKTVEIETTSTIAICKFYRLMITSPLATYYGYEWADTIAHEFAHLVINARSFARVPIWLHEGLAKFMETRHNRAAGQALNDDVKKTLRLAALSSKFITFEQMHPSMAKLKSQEDAALAFAEVLEAVMMLNEKKGIDGLKNLLTQIGQGTSVENAISVLYGKPFTTFLKEWKNRLLRYGNYQAQSATLLKKEIRLKNPLNNDLLAPNNEDITADIKEKKAQDFAKIAQLLVLKGRHQAALVEYEKAFQLTRISYPHLTRQYIQALMYAGDYQKAQKIAEDFLLKFSQDTHVRLQLADIYLAQNQYLKAKAQYALSVYENPYNPSIYQGLLKIAQIEKLKKEEDQYQYYLKILK